MSTFDPTQHPRAADGQFAPTTHADGDVDLAADTGSPSTLREALTAAYRAQEAGFALAAREQFPDANALVFPEEVDDDGTYFAAVYADRVEDGREVLDAGGEPVLPLRIRAESFLPSHYDSMDWDEMQCVVPIDEALAHDGSEAAQARAMVDLDASDVADAAAARAFDARSMASLRERFPEATGVSLTTEFNDDGLDEAFAPDAVDKDGNVLGEAPEDFQMWSSLVPDLRHYHQDRAVIDGDRITIQFPEDTP